MIRLNLGVNGNGDSQEKPAIVSIVRPTADTKAVFDMDAYFARLQTANAVTAMRNSMNDPIIASLGRSI